MNEQLSVLIKMQKIDDIIGKKEELKSALPKELKELEDNLHEANTVLQNSQKHLEENLKLQKTKEMEIAANKDLIYKYENQLLAIKTNKEYKALNSEIATLKTKNGSIDDELLLIMEEESKLRAQVKDDQSNQKSAENDLKSREDLLKQKMVEVEKEIDQLRNDRNHYAKYIPTGLVKRYASLIKNKNRKAVVCNDNNSCSGCGFHIRPQLQIELERLDKIHHCENCGRMLVATMEDNA